jgi:hypothetical protein
VQGDPFFWDTVQLASKHAHFFYENGMRWLPLPIEIDSGHPPLLGYYLGGLWTIFGKSLVVSHWAMAPFLALLVYLPFQIAKAVGQEKWAWLLMVLLWADPVLLGQSALVSPDILVAAGFLSVVWGWKAARRSWVVVGALLLCSSSMRGMMTCAALGLWVTLELYFRQADRKELLRSWIPFLPGAILGISFLIWHYETTGWIGHFEGSTWAAAFERVDGRGFLRNILIVGWRWVDFGRIAEWGLVAFLFFRAKRLGKAEWWLLVGCLVLFLSPSAFIYANLSAHRYFLPLFMAFHLAVWSTILEQNWLEKTKRWLGYGIGFVLITGNLWIYPKGISMDWDATLAQRSYHPLREEALRYLDSLEIDYSKVGSAFPNLNSGEMLLLNGDQRRFSSLNLDENEWVLASNVFNDIDLPEYTHLEAHWDLVRQWEKRGVWIQLYRRRTQAGR